MFCESIMSVVWNIFHFFRIIPAPGSTYTNKIAYIMWLLLIIACTLAILNEELYCCGQISSYSTSKLIATLMDDLLVPLQSVLVIKAVAALGEAKQELKTILMNPKYSLFCLFTTILQLTAYLVVQFCMITANETGHILYFVAWGLQLAMNFLITSASRVIIGVLMNRLCKNIEDCSGIVCPENIQSTISPIITEYRLLQELLSFLLLSVVALDVIMLTSGSYYLATAVGSYYIIPYILYHIFQLLYIAFVLDDCYSNLNTTLPILRYLFSLDYTRKLTIT